MKILAIGDIIGEAGIKELKNKLYQLRQKEEIDFVIVNGENAAEGMGIDTRKYKVYAFGVYGFYAALAGALYAHLVGFISPETFAETQSTLFLIMAMFGGLCSDWGPVIGGLCIVFLTDLLSYLEQYQLLIYGILLILFIAFLPGGVVGEGKKLVTYLKTLKGKKEAAADVKG